MNNLKALTFINITLAFLWFYQGLVPKLLFTNTDEIAIWQWVGLSYDHAKLAGQTSGIIEIFFGLAFLCTTHRYLHFLSIFGLICLLILVACLLPNTLIGAFNPVVMNIAMINLSILYLFLKPTQVQIPIPKI
ncbi:DoxX-like family protein [Acinetobacter sp. ANC 4558]|uniref:DoxX-like family protein n=1 Tax=Acinetobacter sp. ANC 4558 TaxID=1977876 RepID=UPI000A33A38E|nr:DoxX-like family protein [Acinetobacter sp. ANC 4558]OTG88165.1 DoxX-like family protein [Acinetobacter sp. ANC 4558]